MVDIDHCEGIWLIVVVQEKMQDFKALTYPENREVVALIGPLLSIFEDLFRSLVIWDRLLNLRLSEHLQSPTWHDHPVESVKQRIQLLVRHVWPDNGSPGSSIVDQIDVPFPGITFPRRRPRGCSGHKHYSDDWLIFLNPVTVQEYVILGLRLF